MTPTTIMARSFQLTIDSSAGECNLAPVKTTLFFVGLLAIVIGGVAGCRQDGFDGCTQFVEPIADPDADHAAIQRVLGDARPGDVVCFRPGTYPLHDELTLTHSNVELRGALGGDSVLDFSNQERGANGLSVMADGFLMSWLTVKNTAGDALRIEKSTGVTVRNVTITWDSADPGTHGGYGLYPTESTQVLLDHCRVSGASDAGIYVGQSSQIVLRDNEAFGNVAGIEVENSVDAEVYGNFAHDNTAGLLVLNLPSLPAKGCHRVNAHDNRVVDNNGASFAAPGSIVSQLPSGTGILVLASDDNEIHENEIRGNDSIGLGVLSFLVVGDPRQQDPAYDPWPEGNFLHHNHLEGNGLDPMGMAATLVSLVTPGGDAAEQIVWDGAVDPSKTDGSARNCFDANDASYRFLDWDHHFAGSNTDIAPVTCVGQTLPPLPAAFTPPPPPPASTFQPLEHLSEYGFFVGAPAAQQPAPGVLPYDVIAPLYADRMEKQRFIALPAGGKITFDPSGRWQFPDGTTLIKTFSAETAAGEQRLETRLLLLRDGEWWTQTYVYDDTQSDAVRWVPGRTVPVDLKDGTHVDYRVPSSDQCKTCHEQNRVAVPLGPRTRQLNRTFDYATGSENQLSHWAGLGMFSAPLPPLDGLEQLADPTSTSASLDVRARSYLEANCAHCHSATGFASSTSLRLGIETPVGIDLGICRNPNAAGPGSGQLDYDVVPGHPESSILVYRMRSTAPETKMPPIPSTTSDDVGASLLESWVSSLTGSCN
jgi:parallel beta-helix repeat protein